MKPIKLFAITLLAVLISGCNIVEKNQLQETTPIEAVYLHKNKMFSVAYKNEYNEVIIKNLQNNRFSELKVLADVKKGEKMFYTCLYKKSTILTFIHRNTAFCEIHIRNILDIKTSRLN